MSTQSPVYHESNYQQGKFKNGAWHCKHGDRAAEYLAVNSRSLEYCGMKYWKCVNRPSCRFYLWEDHVVEALKFHQVSEDVILKMTPRKRKRDGDITDYFPVTPKTPRTRDVREEGTESDDDIYELSDREASPSGRHRDSSPTPLPRRSNAPSRSLGPPSPPSSWEEALREAAVQSAVPVPPPPAPLAYPPSGAYSVLNTLLSAPVVIASNTAPQVPVQAPPPALVPSYAAPRSNTPPPTLRPENALAPSPAFQPRTPRSNNRGRAMHDMPPPNPPTPGSGRRRLSAQELETYNVVIRALTGANVKLSGKGQKALRDIIKEEDFWIGS